jgi:hypothetical protein
MRECKVLLLGQWTSTIDHKAYAGVRDARLATYLGEPMQLDDALRGHAEEMFQVVIGSGTLIDAGVTSRGDIDLQPHGRSSHKQEQVAILPNRSEQLCVHIHRLYGPQGLFSLDWYVTPLG